MSQFMQALESRRLLTVGTYTYAGDVNLDSTVDGDDYNIVDGYAQGTGTSGWGWGDFNYDGVIDTDDIPSGQTPPSDFAGTAKRDVITVTADSDSNFVHVTVNGATIVTSGKKLKISGNDGNDKIHIDLPDSYGDWLITILGGDGDDVIVGSIAGERIIAGEGNDYIVGNGGRDTVYAEGGDDSVRGGGSSDLLDGGAGNDTIRGDGGNDRMSGGDGFDRMRGSTGDDTMNGGASKDVIAGELGKDSLCGDGGGDVLSGGEDDDILDGGAGSDYCSGDGGNDKLAGGSGVDELFGGGGTDNCATSDDLGERKDTNTLPSVVVPSGGSGGGSGGAYNGVQGEVQRAYDFNAWDQPSLTTSQSDPLNGITTVGVATGGQVGGSYAGQTVSPDSTIAVYTYTGDLNLDGVIDGGDYGVIDNLPVGLSPQPPA